MGQITRWFIAATLGFYAATVLGNELIIISPHRKSIQDEFIPKFKEHYKQTYGAEVKVEWIDQGGTSDNVRFLRAKAAADPKNIGIDVVWGGGSASFNELARDGLLASTPFTAGKGQPVGGGQSKAAVASGSALAGLARDIPERCAGIPLHGADSAWHGSALSSFGVLYNKPLLAKAGLKAPETWADLAHPQLFGRVSATDPRHSGTAGAMNSIILQARGWEQGWIDLASIAGNLRTYTRSSSDPIKAVEVGDVVAAMSIDFYAYGKIAEVGADKLGFNLPKGLTILDPDPVAVVKGAKNRQVAERFVAYLMSPEAQKLWMLPKGAQGGPQKHFLGRMAVRPDVYVATQGKRAVTLNPFEQKSFVQYDAKKAGRLKRLLDDMVGALLVDTHRDLTRAWKTVIDGGLQAEQVKKFGAPPITEAEALELADKWDDNVLRNKKINEWVSWARAKYRRIRAGA